MAVRATQLTNFKGEPYVTKPELEAATSNLQGDLIDETTGNLRQELNPIHITSMEHATPSDGTDANADKKDQDFNNIKFIGNCKVQYGADGTITIRIGDNLNSSLYGTTDGISNATVTGTRNNDASATPSADYNGANGSTAFRVFQSGDTITATTGNTAATADGLTDGTNGTTTHFNDATNGKFKVYIKNNESNEATVYEVGPITGNGTYTAMLGGNTVAGISCVVSEWATEAKTAKGATGYMGNVNFTLTPSSIYSDSTTFQIVKIEMCEGDTLASEWDATGVSDKYIYIKETTKPGTPASADYTINNPTYKWISGVKYIVDSTKFTATATGMTNIGYPAYVSTKANVSPNSDAWFTGFNDSSTGSFTTWTTASGTAMSYSKSDIAIKKGMYSNPQVVIKGNNINGFGSTATSAKSNAGLLICDSDGFVTSGHGSFVAPIEDRFDLDGGYSIQGWGDNDEQNTILNSVVTVNNVVGSVGHLQVYDGFIQYPSGNYTSYNKNGSTAVNPNYSNLSFTGTRYCGLQIQGSGTIAQGTIILTTNKDPKQALIDKKLIICLAKDQYDSLYSDFLTDKALSMDKIATAYDQPAWNSTSKQFGVNFAFSQPSDYCNGTIFMMIFMTSDCDVKIGNITLA